MIRLLFIAAVVVSCQASSFVNAPRGRGCRSPNWKCDCKLVYSCDGSNKFPDDFSDSTIAGEVKNLAPEDYQLRIPGKRWRRKIGSQEKFCKRECHDRLNAFLCLDGSGDPSDYSDSALCLKLLAINSGPFSQDGSDEPCCEIYLQWGLNWCPDKWYKLVRNVRCLYLALDPNFEVAASGATSSHVFSVEGGCTADGTLDFTWCDSAPQCIVPAPQPPFGGGG
ncbi:hypothetical protein BSL78_26953 [Apostichopus japonicus]|uniref:Uncharacterized protein n=1 Tax=Stichopus japonicus TaxID=307972 RepID=A0A2G8JKF6_STIJA|nr:hypothetical protein BSL78_26953 [Apostichopus japonicus]